MTMHLAKLVLVLLLASCERTAPKPPTFTAADSIFQIEQDIQSVRQAIHEVQKRADVVRNCPWRTADVQTDSLAVTEISLMFYPCRNQELVRATIRNLDHQIVVTATQPNEQPAFANTPLEPQQITADIQHALADANLVRPKYTAAEDTSQQRVTLFLSHVDDRPVWEVRYDEARQVSKSVLLPYTSRRTPAP